MEKLLLVLLGIVFGGMAVYSAMRLRAYFENQDKRLRELAQGVDALQQQVKGKQLPFYVRRFLEDHIALEDMQDDELGIMAALYQQMGHHLDSILAKKQKDLKLARSLRAGKYQDHVAEQDRP